MRYMTHVLQEAVSVKIETDIRTAVLDPDHIDHPDSGFFHFELPQKLR